MKSFQESVNESVSRLTAVRKRVRDLATKRREHACSEATCAPRNERFYIQYGYIAPPILCEGVYLCRYGVVHVCTPTTCTRYMENKRGVCPISGVSYGNVYQTDYDKEDARTWYQKPQTSIVSEKNVHRVIRTKRSRTMLMQSGSIFERKIHQEQPEKAKHIPEKEEEEEEAEEKEKEKKAVKKSAQTWKTRPKPFVEKKLKAVITRLLFSHERVAYNEEITEKHADEHKREQERYLQNCKKTGQFPNLIDLHTISNHYNNLPLPMLNIEMDATMLQHYVGMIMQVWDIVAKYADDNSTKVSVEAVALGTLYTLRQGLVYKGIEMIPKDPFISQRGVLPIINDIVRFGFTKKNVTCGEKLIDAAYNRAMSMNISKDELMIDFSKMDAQNEEQVLMIPVGKKGKRVFY